MHSDLAVINSLEPVRNKWIHGRNEETIKRIHGHGRPKVMKVSDPLNSGAIVTGQEGNKYAHLRDSGEQAG